MSVLCDSSGYITEFVTLRKIYTVCCNTMSILKVIIHKFLSEYYCGN